MNRTERQGGEKGSVSVSSSRPETRLRFNARLLPVVLVVMVGLQLSYPYRGWMILLVGLGLAWAISFVWARSLKNGLGLVREMRYGWTQVGDRLLERFTLTNRGAFPAAWVEVADHSTLPDYYASRVTGADSGGSNVWHVDGICTRRGLYSLGPTSLKSGDPLGLYTVSLHYSETSVLLVMPPVVPLPAIAITPGGRAGEGRRRLDDALERTISVAGVRQYQPGDHPGWIHWPTSARRDELFVRVFDSTPSSDCWIFLDLDQSVQLGQGWDSTEEHGVILAASLADRELRAGRALGLAANGAGLVWLPPRGGDAQRMQALRALALVKPGPHPLHELLERARPALKQRSSVVIITPATDRGEHDWVEALVPLLRRGTAPTVLLLDPLSFASPAEAMPGPGVGAEKTAQAVKGTTALLTDLGVAHYLITRDVLDRPEARPGRLGRVEWRVSATGRATAIQRQDTGWRSLGQ
ncbi:MAG: DUF58 domain-containing protein [Thermoflexales bacterium]|nr:DUF58 domain-containing protein [Thermoflexales bacterium]